MKLATGVPRLDHLLDGGLATGSSTLVYGPPFLGKEVLARLTAVASLRAGIPVIMVVTNRTAEEARRALSALPGGLPEGNLLHIVDAYSAALGHEEGDPSKDGIHVVDGPLDFNGIATAINTVQRSLQGHYPSHVVLVDSVSTLVAHSSVQATFRFLQVLLGRARQIGGTALLLLDEGMHTAADVQMMRHLVSGTVDVREHQGLSQLQVRGLGIHRPIGWVDYRYTDDRFDVTGSFAAGRIR